MSYDELTPPNPFKQPGRHRFVGVEQWQTISFTAMHDWVTVYCSDDSEPARSNQYWCSDCPGVLVQESTEIVWHWAEPGEDECLSPRHSGSVGHERITQAVFAAQGDYGGALEEADAGNRLCSMSRTQYQEWMTGLDFQEQCK